MHTGFRKDSTHVLMGEETELIHCRRVSETATLVKSSKQSVFRVIETSLI